MITEHIFIAIGWIVFCILHSLLASLWLKKKVEKWLGRNYQYYRGFYTTFALITFAIVVLQQVSTSSPYLFKQNEVCMFLGGLIAFIGLIAMAISLSKYVFNIYGFNRLFGKVSEPLLIEEGIHSRVRHPLYLGTFLFIWGAWLIFPWVSLLISNVIITVYTLIGIKLEEHKLMLQFGEKYVSYQKRVPMIFPKLKG